MVSTSFDMCFQLVLHFNDIIDYTVVEEVFEMSETVEDPKSGIVGVSKHVAIALSELYRNFVYGAIKWCVNC